MYVACKPLKTNLGPVAIGEVVEAASEWKDTVINAHINMGWMKFVEDRKPGKPASGPKQEAKEKRPKVAKPKAASVPEVVVPEAQVEADAKEVDKSAEDVTCPVCYKTFKTSRARKIHVTTAHKK